MDSYLFLLNPVCSTGFIISGSLDPERLVLVEHSINKNNFLHFAHSLPLYHFSVLPEEYGMSLTVMPPITAETLCFSGV